MTPKKAKNSALVAASKATGRAQIVITAIKYACFAFIAVQAKDVLVAFAGRETIADVGIKFLANVNAAAGIGVVTGVGGIGYGTFQRSQRKKTVTRLSGRIEELEHKIDPKRSSSKIQKNGESNPADNA